MPGRISYNGIFIDFQNEWVRFDPLLISNTSSRQFQSGIKEHLKFFEQEFISTEMRLVPGQDEIQLQRFFEYANDGSTFELWRDKDLGTYISFEGGGNSATVPTITPRGLQTNDKVAGTFTRTAVADSAWFLDPSTGLMTVVPNTNHIPRFVAGRYGQHAIQIDGAATNLIDAPSGPYDSGNWVASNITATANTTETLDPAGTNLADKLLTTASNGSITYTSGTAVGNDAAYSFWLKTSSGSESAVLRIDGSGGGGFTNANITITPAWREFKMTTDTSGFTSNLRVRLTVADNSTVVYGWGAGLFDSFTFSPGTIGAASSSSITRNAEKLTFLSANIINQDKGTIAFWFNPAWVLGSQATKTFFQSGATSTNRHVEIRMAATSRIEFKVYTLNGSGTGSSSNPVVSGITQDQWTHLGLTYDSTISNGVKLYLDGTLDTTSTNDPFSISSVGTNFAIGSTLSGTAEAHCKFDEIIIMQDVKPDAWFQQRFSSGFAIGEGRNYWSSVRLSNLNYVRQALRGGRSTIPLEFEEVLT